MSTGLVPEIQTIARRLVSERERLGLSQATAMVFAGCGRSAWIEKEAGRSDLKGSELARLEPHGFDIHYILTGSFARGALAPAEVLLLETFREMSSHEQSMLLGTALGWAHPTRILPWLAGGTDQEGDFPTLPEPGSVRYTSAANHPRRETLQEPGEKSGK